MKYDVIVVGAGPAGAIAAYEAANLGLKTLLLEKFTLPRDKPCGGAVMYRGIHIVRGKIPSNIIEQKIYGLRFILSDGKEANFKSNKIIGITVFRSLFDEYLARRAEQAGAELHENARVVKVSVSDHGAQVQLSDGRDFESKFLIGADGVNSIVSRSVGLRPERKNPYRIGLGMEADFHVGHDGVMKAMRNDPSILEIIPVDGRVSYGWMFPKKEHLAIGIAGASVHMHPLRPLFESFRLKLEARTGLSLIPDKKRTYFLGGDGILGTNYANRTLLIGDAAGFVDPMMGEGIAYAMRSGQIAATVINSCIENNRYDEKALLDYQRLCHDEFAANFEMAEWAGLKGTSFAETVLSRAQDLEMSSEILAALARGEIGYSQIPPIVLRKLPREIPRLIQRAVQSRIQNNH
ncbi:MAG: NAD(P)/FAD-dependent oxidoreductase [Candidatus Thorarchaeota archaeon]